MDRDEMHEKAVGALVKLMDHAWDDLGYGRFHGAVFLLDALGLDAARIAGEARERMRSPNTVDAVRANEASIREANEREPLPVGDGEPW